MRRRTNPESDISADSCVSAAFCAAVGDYQTSAHNVGAACSRRMPAVPGRALEAPLPSDAGTDPDASLFERLVPAWSGSVSRSASTRTPRPSVDHGLIETLSGGVWSDMETPLPADAGTGSDAGAWLSAVVVPDRDRLRRRWCLQEREREDVGLIDTLTGDTWSAQPAPQPADAAANQDVWVKDISCPSSGTCAAGGFYENGDDRMQALLFSQASGGAWTDQARRCPAVAATGATESSEAEPCPARRPRVRRPASTRTPPDRGTACSRASPAGCGPPGCARAGQRRQRVGPGSRPLRRVVRLGRLCGGGRVRGLGREASGPSSTR